MVTGFDFAWAQSFSVSFFLCFRRSPWAIPGSPSHSLTLLHPILSASLVSPCTTDGYHCSLHPSQGRARSSAISQRERERKQGRTGSSGLMLNFTPHGLRISETRSWWTGRWRWRVEGRRCLLTPEQAGYVRMLQSHCPMLWAVINSDS